MATSIALEASPVARCTYCDIVEDGRPRARVVHSDAPAKGFPAIGSTETRRSRENRKNPVGKYSRRERSTDGRSPRIKILGLKKGACKGPVGRAARVSLSRTRRTQHPPQAHTNPFKMVKMVESAEEFKTLKMGDKPVRASPPRAPPGSFLRVVIKSAVRAFYGPSTRRTRSSRPYPRKLTATPPSARPPVPRSIARALPPSRSTRNPPDRPADPCSFLNNPTPEAPRSPPPSPQID